MTLLAQAFFAALPSVVEPALGETDKLDELLARIIEKAQARWPTVAGLNREELAKVFAGRMERSTPLEAQLERLCTDEVYLARACALGDRAALQAFEETYVSQVDGFLIRFPESTVDEVKQRLRTELLTGAPPKISTYSGRGPLAKWLKVSATRLALSLSTTSSTTGLDEATALEVPASAEEPELTLLKSKYREEFSEAFKEALAALEEREANLLRFHHLEGMNVDALGALYGIHRATAARWIAAAREKLLQSTRSRLQARLPLSVSELNSLVRVLQSSLEVSLRNALRRPES